MYYAKGIGSLPVEIKALLNKSFLANETLVTYTVTHFSNLHRKIEIFCSYFCVHLVNSSRI